MQLLALDEENRTFLKGMLPRIDFFSPLPSPQIDALIGLVQVQGFACGEAVFQQGDAGDAFYLVYRGSVEVQLKKGFWGGSRAVTRLEVGGYFGEIALVNAETRTATVVCPEPTVLLALAAADFAFIVESNPSIRELIARVAAARGRRR